MHGTGGVGGAGGALVQGRAKVCKTKWAPEWLRDRVGALKG